ncbi:MAG: hypothetical protein RRA94_02010 [Bacteroidota bacterium]|nr:hypothetical protein [Bacteroidota bacterium]
MKRLLPCICLLALQLGFASHAEAQNTFERNYGGDRYDTGTRVLETADKGFLVLGTTRSVSNDTTDAWVVRTDAMGEVLWTKAYGGDMWDSGIAMQPGSDGGYVLALASNSVSGNYDILLVKIDEQGETLWTKSYGGPQTEYPHAMAATADGGYVILAHTLSFGMGALDFYLLKVDVHGDSLWSRTYGGAASDWGGTVQQTADGGYILAGDTQSFGDEDGDVYLVKTDAAGDTLWTRTYGGAGQDRAFSVLQTKDGGYLLAGKTAGNGPADERGFILKTDATGMVEWTQVLEGEYNSRLLHAIELSEDAYLVAGNKYVNEAKDHDAYQSLHHHPLRSPAPDARNPRRHRCARPGNRAPGGWKQAGGGSAYAALRCRGTPVGTVFLPAGDGRCATAATHAAAALTGSDGFSRAA